MFTSLKPRGWARSDTRASHSELIGADDDATVAWTPPAPIHILVWTLLIATALLLALHDYYSVQIGMSYDDARYIILARSLLYSDTFGLIHAPGEPIRALYPFGYPLILTPLVWIFPNNIQVLRVPSLIATVFNATLLFWGWRRFSRSTSYWWSLAVVALYLLSPLTIEWSRAVMAEAVFMSYCLIALFLAEHAGWRRRPWWPLVLGSILALAVFTRTVGVVLVASIFLYLLLIEGWRVWRRLAATAVSMMLFVTIVLVSTPVTVDALIPYEYLSHENAALIRNLVGQADVPMPAASPTDDNVLTSRTSDADQDAHRPFSRENLVWNVRQHLGKDLRQAIIPLGGGEREETIAQRLGVPQFPLFFGLAVSAVVILGFVRWYYRERVSALWLFAVLYSGILYVWPWEGTRLLYPIQPQIFLAFLLGIDAVLLGVATITSRLERTPRASRLRQQLVSATVIVLVILAVVGSLRIADSRIHTGDLAIRSAWLREHTVPTDVIMTEVPELDYLYSDRLAVWYPGICDTAGDLQNYLTTNNVDYILVAPKLEWEPQHTAEYSDLATCFTPLFETLARAGQLELVYSSEPTMIRVFRTTY